VPKRVAHHAPKLFASLLEDQEVTFLHYMGAKPWMDTSESRRGADWEANNAVYVQVLERFWWKIRLGQLAAPGAGAGPSLCTRLREELRHSGVLPQAYAAAGARR
jgi:lipopolysaccharide biosynthesis glycosyltransferase